MKTRRMLIAVVVVIAVIGAACNSSSEPAAPETTTTSFDFPDLEFGRGVLPASVPSPFPMPDQVVIGATMIDGTRRITEVVVTFSAEFSDVAAYYTTNLPTLGYDVTSVSGSDGAVEIEFAGNGVTGTISLTAGGAGLAAGTIQFFHA